MEKQNDMTDGPDKDLFSQPSLYRSYVDFQRRRIAAFCAVLENSCLDDRRTLRKIFKSQIRILDEKKFYDWIAGMERTDPLQSERLKNDWKAGFDFWFQSIRARAKTIFEDPYAEPPPNIVADIREFRKKQEGDASPEESL